MFAETSDAVQIATLITGMVTTCFSAYLAFLMYKMKLAGDMAAVKVDAVKTSLEEHREANGAQMTAMAADVATVKKQTNGLMEVVTKSANEAGFAAGAASEQHKHEP